MILRHYYRLYAIHIQNIAGMICVHGTRSIEWIWVECAKIACHGDGLIHDGQKERIRTFCTLDSNPFNDVYSIFMLSVILIMRIEWKELKTDENVFGCDLESNLISVINNWKWMSYAQIWFRNGCVLWLGLECYIWLNHWCWQGHSV